MDFTVEIKDMIAIVISIICRGVIGFERDTKMSLPPLEQ